MLHLVQREIVLLPVQNRVGVAIARFIQLRFGVLKGMPMEILHLLQHIVGIVSPNQAATTAAVEKPCSLLAQHIDAVAVVIGFTAEIGVQLCHILGNAVINQLHAPLPILYLNRVRQELQKIHPRFVGGQRFGHEADPLRCILQQVLFLQRTLPAVLRQVAAQIVHRDQRAAE